MYAIFITGRPKSGKTTLAYALHNDIKDSIVFDGDELRDSLGYKGFSKEDRDAWVRKVGNLAVRFAMQGKVPIIALVSPYASIRKEVRDKFLSVGIGFVLVYIKGSDKHMWIDSVYEEPSMDENPVVIDRTEGVTDYEGIFYLYRRCFG